MTKLTDKILNAVSTEVFVTIAPEVILLSRKQVKVTIKAVIFLSLDGPDPKIVGVGDELSSSAANRRVDLFQKNSWNHSIPSKKELLTAFFKHCMRKVHKDTRTIVRPRIIVKNSQSLETILCGYQEDLIQEVLIESGAREVVFEA